MTDTHRCEFCRELVVLACADPAWCLLGNSSQYIKWQAGRLPPGGNYRVRLDTGEWRDAVVVSEGTQQLLTISPKLLDADRRLVGYVRIWGH